MTVSACLWLGLFPLVQFGTYQSLTHDKWICMLILAGLTLVCFLTDILMRRVSSPRLLPLLLGAGLLLWTVVSCLASPYPGAPWWIGTGRREGLATQLCYFALFFMFAFSKVRRTPVLIASGCGVLLFAAVVLLQRSGGNPLGLYPDSYSFENASYFQGTIGNVDMCSGYLVIVCGLFLSELVETLRAFFHPVPPSAENGLPAAGASSGPVPEKRSGKLSGWMMPVFLLPLLRNTGSPCWSSCWPPRCCWPGSGPVKAALSLNFTRCCTAVPGQTSEAAGSASGTVPSPCWGKKDIC